MRTKIRILAAVIGVMLLCNIQQALACSSANVARGRVLSGTMKPGSMIVFTGEDSYNPSGIPSGAYQEWEWQFDYKGTFSADKHQHETPYVSWTYSKAGTYTVMLKYIVGGRTASFYSFQVVISDLKRYYYVSTSESRS
jgi:hypothetical protein